MNAADLRGSPNRGRFRAIPVLLSALWRSAILLEAAGLSVVVLPAERPAVAETAAEAVVETGR